MSNAPPVYRLIYFIPRGEFQQLMPFPMDAPKSIVNIASKQAKKYATILCQISNNDEEILALRNHLTEGTVPKHLALKFRKMFQHDHETHLKESTLTACINHAIEQCQEKKLALKTSYDNRNLLLGSLLDPALGASGFSYEAATFFEMFLTHIQTIWLDFNLKSERDKSAKLEKAEKFALYKENQDLDVTLKARDILKTAKSIKALQKEITNLKIQVSKHPKPRKAKTGNVKGGPKKKPTGPPKPKRKSTGTGKRKGGKGRSTAAAKKSPGQNGRQ
jgi:hypothetical protein